MNKIEVKVIDTSGNAGEMMAFLARLTQRGHNIKCMDDLLELKEKSFSPALIKSMADLPHGTIKRFCPITIAIVGASRRFLAQARTHQVGTNYVSASLQYSNYAGEADFVVPYALMEATANGVKMATEFVKTPIQYYLDSCKQGMIDYANLADTTDNDTAGYAAPQGLRNILIMQGNHQSWDYFIRTRGCNRNTVETQYVTMRIWEELLKTEYGEEFFGNSGADCMPGACREGKMCCGSPMKHFVKQANARGVSVPRLIIDTYWPLLKEV